MYDMGKQVGEGQMRGLMGPRGKESERERHVGCNVHVAVMVEEGECWTSTLAPCMPHLSLKFHAPRLCSRRLR